MTRRLATSDIDQLSPPTHIAVALYNGDPRCECGQPATLIGWMEQYSGSAQPIINAILVCASCASQLGADVILRPLVPSVAASQVAP
jgi:hypothetical protein